MSQTQHFPPGLLTQSTPQRLTYFSDYTMAHPRLEDDDSISQIDKKLGTDTTTGRRVTKKVGQPKPKRRQVGT